MLVRRPEEAMLQPALLVLPGCASADHFPIPSLLAAVLSKTLLQLPGHASMRVPCSDGSPLQYTQEWLCQPQVSHLPSVDVLRGDLKASDDRWLQSREHIFKICLL